MNSSLADSIRCAGGNSSSIDTITATMKYNPSSFEQLTDCSFYSDLAKILKLGSIGTSLDPLTN